MTTWKLDHTFADLSKFDKYFVGADKYFAQAQRINDLLANTATAVGYPPFNLKKTDENTYVVEMAVAGFGKQDLEMTLEENKLRITGRTTLDNLVADGIEQKFLHKGISDRPFERTFTLADNVVIKNTALTNGLLKIWLEHIIPEDKKPKKIEINEVEKDETTSKKTTKE
jgi:molecular chaperone IbpA